MSTSKPVLENSRTMLNNLATKIEGLKTKASVQYDADNEAAEEEYNLIYARALYRGKLSTIEDCYYLVRTAAEEVAQSKDVSQMLFKNQLQAAQCVIDMLVDGIDNGADLSEHRELLKELSGQLEQMSKAI